MEKVILYSTKKGGVNFYFLLLRQKKRDTVELKEDDPTPLLNNEYELFSVRLDLN